VQERTNGMVSRGYQKVWLISRKLQVRTKLRKSDWQQVYTGLCSLAAEAISKYGARLKAESQRSEYYAEFLDFSISKCQSGGGDTLNNALEYRTNGLYRMHNVRSKTAI